MSFPHHLTWEFTSDTPVRSLLPLWPVYGLPIVVLHWIWSGIGTNHVPPQITYYGIRALMLLISFVLEDWAIHELVQSTRQRRLAVTLVASSYVTWTYQTHTFSNSIETVVVLWSLVMIQRILDNKVGGIRICDPSPSLTPAATVFASLLSHSGAAFYLWGFQPYHVSCIRLDTQFSPPIAVSPQVCPPTFCTVYKS